MICFSLNDNPDLGAGCWAMASGLLDLPLLEQNSLAKLILNNCIALDTLTTQQGGICAITCKKMFTCNKSRIVSQNLKDLKDQILIFHQIGNISSIDVFN